MGRSEDKSPLEIKMKRWAGASELWSEDLNAGQDFAGVRVVNPLV